jgi:hypothetical protein
VLNRRRFHCCEPERIGAFFEHLGPFQAVVEANASYEWLVKLLGPPADRSEGSVQRDGPGLPGEGFGSRGRSVRARPAR